MTIDVFEVKGTKEVNGDQDLDALVVGDVVKVYFGHNYGELMSKSLEMKYVSTEGRKVLFDYDNSRGSRTLVLSKDFVSYRDGVIVHPQQQVVGIENK